MNRYRIPLGINQISKLDSPAERYAGFEPQGVSNIATLAQSKCKNDVWIIGSQ